jgi:hypothetical protein
MRGVSNYDTTQQVNMLGVYELPFGRHRHFGANMNRVLDAFVGGWQLSGIYRQTTGLPFTVINGQRWPTNWNEDANATPGGPIPVSLTQNATGIKGGGPNAWQNPIAVASTPGEAPGVAGAFVETLPGQSGLRNNFRGWGLFNIDSGLYKVFTITERAKLQFRWESFNISNTPVFANPSGSSVISVSNFGKVTGTLTQPRQMQFAMRLSW